jgi:hypothetical protein
MSVDDADQYHYDNGDYLGAGSWITATSLARQQALRMATQYLDATYHSAWQGQRINDTMSLDWPRYQVTDSDGFWLAPTAVPQQIKDACAYLAGKYIDGDTLMPDDTAGQNIGSESVTVGPITTSTTYTGEKGTTKYYRLVERLIGELTGGDARIYRA